MTSTAPLSATLPVLKVTRYDKLRASLTVVVMALAMVVFVLVLVWMSHHHSAESPRAEYSILVENGTGGTLDGTPGETPGGADGPPAQFSRVESAPETKADPSHLETENVEREMSETIATVAAVSTNAPPKPQQLLPRNAPNIGQTIDGLNHKQLGTGRLGLGDGPGVRGFSHEARWVVRFEEGSTLEEYARQLDFFQIELGVILPEGVLVYLSNLSAPRPSARRVTSTDDEKRLYLVWQTEARRKVDEQLFQRAGVHAGDAAIMHFVPVKIEEQLARAEREYAHRDARKIARTYFKVSPDGSGGYRFVVTGQTPIE